jgi:hypothetical protein
LWEKLMASPGNHLESIEIIQKVVAGALLIGQVFVLGSLDAPLETVLVQLAE